MLVKVFKDDIIEGLQKSTNIIPVKTGAAFLRTIWLKTEDESLKIMSTDSNLEFCGAYQAEIVEQGLVGVQGRSFYDLIRKLPPGRITLRLDEENKNLHIEQGNRNYTLPTNETTWFQNLSDFPNEDSVFWSGDYLQEMIDKISYCISDEDAREAIACMSIKPIDSESKYIEAAGLNGHQFAMLRLRHDDFYSLLPEEGILIQKKYIGELKKWLPDNEIELSISNKRLFFRTQDSKETFSLPLSYYQFPDYTSFLAKLTESTVSSMQSSKNELVESLDRLMIFNTENNKCTYFEFTDKELTLTTQGREVGSAVETLEIEFNGEIPKIAFPTRNLIEILGHFQSELIKFTLSDVEGPCGIEGEDDPDYIVIIMPMKIVEETYYSEEDA